MQRPTTIRVRFDLLPTRRMRNVHRQQVSLEQGAAAVAVGVAVAVAVAVQGQQQFNYAPSRSLTTHTLSSSHTANPSKGGPIQRMLYASGRPTWGRRVTRTQRCHWSLAFSALLVLRCCVARVRVLRVKCNSFLLLPINWSCY